MITIVVYYTTLGYILVVKLDIIIMPYNEIMIRSSTLMCHKATYFNKAKSLRLMGVVHRFTKYIWSVKMQYASLVVSTNFLLSLTGQRHMSKLGIVEPRLWKWKKEHKCMGLNVNTI